MVTDDPSTRYADFFAAERMEQVISAVVIAYRLTLTRAPRVETTPWRHDDTLPEYAIRVHTSDHEIILHVTDWGDHPDELRTMLRQWIRDHVRLEQARINARARRVDPYWRDAWRAAHPWG